MNKIFVFIQARENSRRFPKKVLKKINNLTIIQIIYRRLSASKNIDNIYFLVPYKDSQLIAHLKSNKIPFLIGCEKNVLKRFYDAACFLEANHIVRITADCPFVDPELIDNMIAIYKSGNYDYLSNIDPPSFPDGLDVEIFNFKSLKKNYNESRTLYNKEHVTPYFRANPKISKFNYFSNTDYSDLRLTLDYESDLKLIRKIYYYKKNFTKLSLKQIISIYDRNKSDFDINKRFSSKIINTNDKNKNLWTRAKNIIPSGNMLLSKNPKSFIEHSWPTYFSKTKKYYVWDLNNKRYIDFSTMGVGTNILGYNNKAVDKVVKKIIESGVSSTLNCPEEVILSEKLIKIHPWAKMVKLTRTGGEANTVAIRIARAFSQKNKVIICGYHGWHDWWLAANLSNPNNLNTHLLPYLKINGVPNFLKNNIYSFDYNNIRALKNIIKNNADIGVLIMEPKRDQEPNKNFLKLIRKICDDNKIVLIFDECTSGFRENLGGIHLKYKVYPDICVLGKALGNGYAINAVIGKERVMKSANESFIISTFWTERIGPAAAISALNEMERTKSWKLICSYGKYLKKRILEISNKYELKITFKGLESLIIFTFDNKNANFYYKIIIQEMLKNNFLAKNAIYLSIFHDKKIIDKYINILEKAFFKIALVDKVSKN